MVNHWPTTEAVIGYSRQNALRWEQGCHCDKDNDSRIPFLFALLMITPTSEHGATTPPTPLLPSTPPPNLWQFTEQLI